MDIRAAEQPLMEQLDRLRADLDCDFCALGELEGEERALRWVLASGNANERFRSIAERVGVGIAGSVMKVGRPMSLQWADLLAVRRIHEYPIMLAESLRSAYAVPIVAGAHAEAVLLAGDRHRRIYRPEDRKLAVDAGAAMLRLLMETSLRDRRFGEQPPHLPRTDADMVK